MVVLSAGLAGCAAGLPAGNADPCPFPGQRPTTRLELFFGRDIPGGGRVSDAAWQDFSARVLTPAFPDGFSTISAAGQWFDPQRRQIIKEESRVVLVAGKVVPSILANVVQTYRAWFRQEAVGVLTSNACAVF